MNLTYNPRMIPIYSCRFTITQLYTYKAKIPPMRSQHPTILLVCFGIWPDGLQTYYGIVALTTNFLFRRLHFVWKHYCDHEMMSCAWNDFVCMKSFRVHEMMPCAWNDVLIMKCFRIYEMILCPWKYSY